MFLENELFTEANQIFVQPCRQQMRRYLVSKIADGSRRSSKTLSIYLTIFLSTFLKRLANVSMKPSSFFEIRNYGTHFE